MWPVQLEKLLENCYLQQINLLQLNKFDWNIILI